MHYLLVWKDRLGTTNQEYGHMTFLIHVFWRQSRPAQDFLNTTFLYCSAQFKIEQIKIHYFHLKIILSTVN